jgi:CheY-like chemotaxis protein
MVRRHSILIVDDEPSVCFLLKEELSELKQFSISTVNDGAEAINLLQKQPIDVVLLDVRMPRMNGLEAVSYTHLTLPTIYSV